MILAETLPHLLGLSLNQNSNRMKKAINKGFALHLYLEFVNNYLTVEKMSLDWNINPYALTHLLKEGKKINEQKAKEIKEQKRWAEYLAK
ncbi:MAG: hypothetical protein RL158_1033 [Bacteroidota bacterium]